MFNLEIFLRTLLEQIWYDIFKENNISFEEQVPIGKYQADFIIGKFDVEIDGYNIEQLNGILNMIWSEINTLKV